MSELFIGLALVAAAPALKDPPAKAPTIEGDWMVTASVAGGKDDGVMTKSPIDKIIITADRWIVVRGGMHPNGSEIAVDLKKSPPHLDIGVTPETRGCKAIFKLDGDTLTVCYVLSGDRPTKIESPPDSQIRMMTLKRMKK
jgi:uncharacterized protein (TIGR03067 family)